MAVSKPFRIVMHWTAGAHEANANDRKHYHEIVEVDGTRVPGDLLPEANNSTADGVYAAHTRKFNTGAIGLAMAGMAGAQERPFRKGKFPLTEPQLDAFISVVAEYAHTYDIPITRETVLSHKEVHHTHDIFQDKWDIMWLPHMAKPGHAVEVGDHLRERIKARYDELFGDADGHLFAAADRSDLVERIIDRIREELA